MAYDPANDPNLVGPQPGSNSFAMQNSTATPSWLDPTQFGQGAGALRIAQDMANYTGDPTFGSLAPFSSSGIGGQNFNPAGASVGAPDPSTPRTPTMQQLLSYPSDLTPIHRPGEGTAVGEGGLGPTGYGGAPQLFSLPGDPAASGWTQGQTPYQWNKNGTQIQQFMPGQYSINQSTSPALRALQNPGMDPNRYYGFQSPAGTAMIDTASYGYQHGLPANETFMPDASNVATGFVGRGVPEVSPRGTRAYGSTYYYPGQMNQVFGGIAMPGDYSP